MQSFTGESCNINYNNTSYMYVTSMVILLILILIIINVYTDFMNDVTKLYTYNTVHACVYTYTYSFCTYIVPVWLY